MASEPKNLGTLFIIPTSIEQHENVTFLLDEQKIIIAGDSNTEVAINDQIITSVINISKSFLWQTYPNYFTNIPSCTCYVFCLSRREEVCLSKITKLFYGLQFFK